MLLLKNVIAGLVVTKMNSYELPKNFPFRHISNPTRIIHLNNVANSLLEMFCLCVEMQESAVILTWPSQVENIAIFHALAELLQLVTVQGEEPQDKMSICTYFWPWKPHANVPQKRLLVDRDKLVKGNQRFLLVQEADFEFHMVLNRIKDLDPTLDIKSTLGGGHHSILERHPELVHPTLFEITPQTVFQEGIDNHSTLAELGFLNKARKYILNDPKLYQIKSTPFFMLGIPITCSRTELIHGNLFTTCRPDIVLLDMNSVYNRIGYNWQKQISEFLDALGSVFASNERGLPPILAITDDPLVFNRLFFKLLADYEEKRQQRRSTISRYSFLNVAQSLFDHKRSVAAESPVPSFMVASYADNTVDLFVAGQTLRNKFRVLGSEQLAEQVDTLNHTVRNAVSMPGGLDNYMKFLQDYCDQSGQNIRSVALKPLEEWIKTKEFIDEGDAGAERLEADAYLKSCRTIIEGLKNETPLQSILDVLYPKLLEKHEGCHAVVFASKQMKEFAAWMISNHWKGVASADENDAIKLVLFDGRESLESFEESPNRFEHVYIILPRQKYLSKILAQNTIPPNLTFVCDGGTVLSLLRYVGILEKVPGLEILRPRLTAMHKALQEAADSRVTLLEELDEVKLMANALIYNLRESDPGDCHGHPVVIMTDDGASISAYEGSDILRYQEENDLQPFSKVTVSQLHVGDKFFVITPEFLEAASDIINITAMATESLKDYHTRVGERVRDIHGGSLREKAEVIQRRMKEEGREADIGEGDNVGNIVRWIDVERLLEIPRELVRPHAPRHRRVFNLFMKALGVSDGEIDWYWAAAIQSTRKIRIRIGLDRNRVFYRLLLDPTSIEQFFHGDKGDLLNLIDIACRNVFTASQIIKERDDEHPEH